MKKYIFKHKLWFFNTLLIMSVTLGLKLASMLWTAQALQSLVSQDIHATLNNIILATISGGLYASLYYVSGVVQTRFITQNILDIQVGVANRLAKKRPDKLHQKESGEYTSWLVNDVDIIEQQGYQYLFLLIEAIIEGALATVSLFFFHWTLIVLTLVLAVIVLFLPKLVEKRMILGNQNFLAEKANFLSKANEAVGGFDTLYTLNALPQLVNTIKAAGSPLRDASSKMYSSRIASLAIGFIGNVVSSLLLVAWTMFLVFQKVTGVGSVLAIGQLSKSIFNAVANLGPLLAGVNAVAPIFDKIEAIDEEDEAIETSSQPVLNDVTLLAENLAVENQLKPISFTVPAKSKVLLVGESGSGKSTLLNLLAGKTNQYKGRLKLGQQVAHWTQLVKQVAYLDQTPYIFTGTVRDNLLLDGQYSESELWDALRQARLDDTIRDKQDQLDFEVGEHGGNLSGGEKQRLSLARVLLRNKSIILVDEGTSGLSPEEAIRIEQNLLDLADKTVIMVTHQEHDELRNQFDQIISIT